MILSLLAGCATSSAAPAAPPAGEHHAHRGQHPDRRHAHHRGMPHRFKGPDRWAKVFDDPKRDSWQKPGAVLRAMALQPGMTVADIGAGTGYFTVRFARALPGGKALGIDVEKEMVDYLAKRARKEGLKNLDSRLGAHDDPRLPGPVDRIFLCNTYHHIENRPAYFRRALKNLAPGGWIVDVDFKKEPTPMGPPQQMRITPEQLDRELGSIGLKRVSLDTRTLPYQYIAIYSR
jgi:ubiquinone/menaquinone biosynthesis C-methylase UbiE